MGAVNFTNGSPPPFVTPLCRLLLHPPLRPLPIPLRIDDVTIRCPHIPDLPIQFPQLQLSLFPFHHSPLALDGFTPGITLRQTLRTASAIYKPFLRNNNGGLPLLLSRPLRQKMIFSSIITDGSSTKDEIRCMGYIRASGGYCYDFFLFPLHFNFRLTCMFPCFTTPV